MSKKLRIFTHPKDDAILRQVSKKVRLVTNTELDLLDTMLKIMYDNSGVGLAAPQIGILQRLIVLDIGEGPKKLINPKIISKSENFAIEKEGCLSLPGLSCDVPRAESIVVETLNEKNKKIIIKAKGLFARAIQHEIDHLDGKLTIDYSPKS